MSRNFLLKTSAVSEIREIDPTESNLLRHLNNFGQIATKQFFFEVVLGNHPNFLSWIAAVKGDNTMAMCTKYKTTFYLSNMRELAFRAHMKGKKHSQKVAPVQCFF